MREKYDTDDDLHDDDQPVECVFTRREVLRVLGGAGFLVMGGCSIQQFLGDSPESTVIPNLSLTNTPEATALAAEVTEDVAQVTTLPSCVVRPALTEEPYFVDAQLDQSDIRSELSDVSECTGRAVHP